MNPFAHLLSYDAATGKFRWLVGKRAGKEAGFGRARGRIQVCVDGRNYYAHRLAWVFVHGAWPDGVIDHINGNPLDNRIENLRSTDQSGNLENQRAARTNNLSSGRLGVSGKNGRWRAAIRLKGRSIHLGTFDSPDAASAAYLSAKRQLHKMCTI